MAKDKRSNKWAFLIYKESAPEDYLDVLEEMHVPFIVSPWHDKDISRSTGEFKKAHKHGALFFETLKSYTPAHIEVVMSPKGMYDYFTHAENPEKTLYNIDDIESGAGFELDKFLAEQSSDEFLNKVIDLIEDNDITEFEVLVYFARANDYMLLNLVIDKTYFFAKFLDSRRHNPMRKIKQNNEVDDDSNSK